MERPDPAPASPQPTRSPPLKPNMTESGRGGKIGCIFTSLPEALLLHFAVRDRDD